MLVFGYDTSVGAVLGTAVLSFLAITAVRLFLSHLEFRKIMNAFPGEEDFSWLYGNLHKFGWPHEKGLDHQRALTARFPFVHRIWFGPIRAILLVHHPETVKVILKSSDPKPRKVGFGPSSGYDYGVPWLGEGLLLANGKKRARNRRLLTPAFHFDMLQNYIMIYNKCTDILLDKIETCKQTGQSFEVFNFISLCSIDILLRCAFSYHTDCQTAGDVHLYVHAVGELSDLWFQRSLKPQFKYDFIYKLSSEGRRYKKHCDYVHGVAEKIIAERKEALGHQNSDTDTAPNRKYMDFLDILLKARDENGDGLTPLEIRNEVDSFLFGGHDTTTTGTSWILYCLAQHPEIQERVRAEVDEVMKDKSDETLDGTDLHKLEYLAMCIKEGLRLYPPVFWVGRKMTKAIEIDGRKVPLGTEVWVHIYETHHNPHVWENSEEFQPDRFLPENVAKRDPFAFIGFSAGPRNCMGQNFAMQEMKTIIAKILYRYKLNLDPTNTVRKRLSIVLKSETGIKVFARPRTDSNHE